MSSVPPRDRPDDEIEITPEMIEAGARILMATVDFVSSEPTARLLVKDILEEALRFRT